MNELIKVNYDNDRPTVSARDLHFFLECTERFNNWFDRMSKYGFTETEDYLGCKVFNTQARQELQDYQLTIEMAKELCMLQRNDKGKQARQYFINLEKAWNTPEAVMARALRLAEEKLNSVMAINSKLSVEVQVMQPKADYFDELVDRNLLTNFRETAKQLGIKQNKFIAFLLDKKYLYRDKRGKLMPYANKNNGLFEIKETFNDKTEWAGTQTLVTPKGRETFRLLCI